MHDKRFDQQAAPLAGTAPEAATVREPDPAAPRSPGAQVPAPGGYAIEDANPQDVAAYMADMLLELKELAEKSGFETLGKVLEIAEREAQWRKAAR